MENAIACSHNLIDKHFIIKSTCTAHVHTTRIFRGFLCYNSIALLYGFSFSKQVTCYEIFVRCTKLIRDDNNFLYYLWQ